MTHLVVGWAIWEEKKAAGSRKWSMFPIFLSSALNTNISSVNKMIMLESALNAKEHCHSEGASVA